MKKKYIKKNEPPISQVVLPEKDKVQYGKSSHFIPQVNPSKYGDIVFGAPNFPLAVDNGFTTEIPYNNAINAKIITNPNPIPITSLHQAMYQDPVIKQCMLQIATHVVNAIKEYYVPNNQLATDIANKTLESIGQKRLIKHLNTSLAYGFACGRKHQGEIQIGNSIRSTYIDIELLPANSIIMSVNELGRLDENFGLMQYYYTLGGGFNQSPSAYTSDGNATNYQYGSAMTPQRTPVANLMYVSPIIAEERLLLSFNPTTYSSNYYGDSLINAVWSQLQLKNFYVDKLRQAMTYQAFPMTFISTDSQQTVEFAQGKYEALITNLSKTLPQATQAGYQLVDGLNSTRIDSIKNEADLEKMLKLVEYQNAQIRTGIISADSVNNAGSYANGMANQQAPKDFKKYVARMIADCIREQVILPSLQLALGEKEYPKDWGDFIIETSIEDKMLEADLLLKEQQLSIYFPDILDDQNYARQKTGREPIDAITKEMKQKIAIASGDMSIPNTMETKTKIGTPYAQGQDKVDKNHYGAKA